jgi:hypothetical protein
MIQFAVIKENNTYYQNKEGQVTIKKENVDPFFVSLEISLFSYNKTMKIENRYCESAFGSFYIST